MTNLKRGRPAEFRNAAEKQKAYRERQKQQKESSDLALALLNDVNTEIVTLRKSLEYHLKKGAKLKVQYSHMEGFNARASLYVNDSYGCSPIDILVFRHLARIGALVFDHKTWHGEYWIFTEKF